jgi:hypothetical protein
MTHPILCFTHEKSFLIEGNINHISITQELCLIYNSLFKLNMTFTESLNNNYTNIMVENLPYLIFGGIPIKKNFIPDFLKKLVSLEKMKNINSDKLLQIEADSIEKTILFDIQLGLNLYNYMNFYQKTNSLWKVLKTVYQPWITYRTYLHDKETLLELRKLLGISSKYDALEFLKNNNQKIENFLANQGENYFKIQDRQIYSIDLLIYACIKAQIRILDNGIKISKIKFESYPNIINLVKEIDSILLNDSKNVILIQRKILTPDEIGIPKFTITDKNFGRYLDTPKESPEIIRRSKIRKSVISSTFFGFLLVLKLSYITLKLRKAKN